METNLIYDMYVPTRLMFGAGVLNQLNEQPMPGKRALIVISNGKSTRANGYLARTEEQLRKAGVETTIFDQFASFNARAISMVPRSIPPLCKAGKICIIIGLSVIHLFR